jgi:hypothetical protein
LVVRFDGGLGGLFGWCFKFMPVGKDPRLDLFPTPERRVNCQPTPILRVGCD